MHLFGFCCCCLPSCDPPIPICVSSLSSLSSVTHKPKDPPWLALVQSESKKKKAPPRPPAGLATPPNAGSLSSLKGDDSRPSTPPPPANPFEDDDDENNEVEEEEEGAEGGAIPPTVVANHPWYRISQAADATGADTPPSGGSSSRSASPGSAKSKKRAAPQAPKPSAGNQGQFHQNCTYLVQTWKKKERMRFFFSLSPKDRDGNPCQHKMTPYWLYTCYVYCSGLRKCSVEFGAIQTCDSILIKFELNR